MDATAISRVVADTDCTTAIAGPDGDVVCTRSGSIVSWTMSEGRLVHIRSTVDGWLGSYARPSQLDVSRWEGEIFIRARVDKIVTDTPCG